MKGYITEESLDASKMIAQLLKFGRAHKIYTNLSPITQNYEKIFGRVPLFCVRYDTPKGIYYVYGNSKSVEKKELSTRCGVYSSVSIVDIMSFKTPGPHAPVAKIHATTPEDTWTNVEAELLKLL